MTGHTQYRRVCGYQTVGKKIPAHPLLLSHASLLIRHVRRRCEVTMCRAKPLVVDGRPPLPAGVATH